MKPPYCRICGTHLKEDSKGGLIYFRKTLKDLDWDKKMEQIKGVGHPPYADWFCESHYAQAYKLKDYPIVKAVSILKINSQI